MTSEIVIMNTQAVAMAADSAVTLGGQKTRKIFTTALKIFALSNTCPVGIMIYGNADFMLVPWETLVKTYRNYLGKKEFPFLRDYAHGFIKYLRRKTSFFPESQQKSFFKSQVSSYFYLVKRDIDDQLKELTSSKPQFSIEDVQSIIEDVVNRHYKKWKRSKTLPSLPRGYQRNLVTKYKGLIEEMKKRIFEKLPLSKVLSSRLVYIASALFAKFPEGIESGATSGIVIAGFGSKDIFPSLYSYTLEGIVNNQLKYQLFKKAEVSSTYAGVIVPFAQAEMVFAFMEGVDIGYEKEIEAYFRVLCAEYPKKIIDSIDALADNEKEKFKQLFRTESKKVHGEYMRKLEEYRRKNNVDPVMSVVTMLPKDELAAMAESLVYLTLLKRKVTIGEEETVAGPIDVAIISKGDGFIWIKRKHYFRPELNPQFFARYKGERKNGVKTQDRG